MEKVELHFFHGFLGDTRDWKQYKNFFKSYDCYFHSLIDDFQKIEHQPDGFQAWSDLKSCELRKRDSKKVLIGYSLGGRLLMHLPEGIYEKMVLVASHPGLKEKKPERLKSDQAWIKKISSMPWSTWLKDWNSQQVFEFDKKRPSRLEQESNKDVWAKILLKWSLSAQETRDSLLKESCEKIYWMCGAEDKKFLDLLPRLSECLEPSHIGFVEQAGHGVIFDNPKALAAKIQGVLDGL